MKSVTSIIVVILIDTVISITNVKINNVPLKTASLLLNTLNKYGNKVKYVKIHPNIWKEKDVNDIGKSESSGDHIGTLNDYSVLDTNPLKLRDVYNRLLIKRLIPHGLSTSGLEYDAKYKTFYNPLVRVHKRKALPKIGTILNIGNRNNIGIDKYGIDVYDYFDNDENVLNFLTNNESNNSTKLNVKHLAGSFNIDNALLQPFTDDHENLKANQEFTSQLRILRKIKNLMKNSRSISNKLKTYDYIMKILDEMEILRSMDKSGEVSNHMIPGAPLPDEVNTTTKPKKLIPHYPPWNYWTYKKTIHQDICPEGQVKIANRCIWLPPH